MGLRRGPAIVSRGLLSAYDFASVRSYPYQDSPGGTSPLLKDLVGDNDMTVEGSPTFFGNNSNSASFFNCLYDFLTIWSSNYSILHL